MIFWLVFFSGIIGLWLVAYQQYSAKYWFTGVSIWLPVLLVISGAHWVISSLFILTGMLLLAITWKDELRKNLLSLPLMKQFNAVLPPMSSTEKAAIDAGSVWWDGELFTGKPDWQYLLDYPVSKLSDEEQQFIDGPVQQLCEMLDDWQVTHEDHDLPLEVWDFIKQQGFFGMIIPKRYGGLEFSAYAHSTVVMKLASRCITSAVTVMVPNSLGPAKLLLHYGTEQQKETYLPRLADGREIPCFALTAPDAGSDAGSIKDTGIICYADDDDGQKQLGIRLDFDKRYITLGPVATLIGLAVKLYDPDHLLGEHENLGITVVLIPGDIEGLDAGNRHIPMDLPFQNGPVRGKNLFVPIEQVIGGVDGVGHGWRMLVECLSEGRGISLPALSTGAGKAACRYTGAYAAIRQQFNLPIGRFEGVQQALSRIAGLTYEMDAARSLTLSAIDQGESPSVISAIVKYHLTERYRQVTNDAMDVQGGSGICLGPSNLVGRAYQAIPIAITVEGANILTRSMIIFGQGAIRAHPWLLKEMQAASDSSGDAVDDFDTALLGHTGFLLGNLARSVFLGLTRGRFSHSPVNDPVSKRYFQYLNWMSASFALAADVTMMTLGGALKRKERLSARLGDVLSELYISSAVLKHFHEGGCPVEEQPLLHWSLHRSLYRIQESLRSLFRNLPYKPLGNILGFLVFPSGLPFTDPVDKTASKVARILLRPSSERERLTEGVFLSERADEKVHILETAFILAEKASRIESTLKELQRNGLVNAKSLISKARQALAEGLISQADLDLLEEMQALRSEIIHVDDFDDYGHQYIKDKSI